MADGFHDRELHHLTSQEAKRPVGVPFGRGPRTHRDDLGFLFAVKQLLGRWFDPLGPVECFFEASLDQPLTNILDRLGAARKRLGDPLIRLLWSVGIRLQQDLSAANLLTRPLQFLDDLDQCGTFQIRQSDDILLLHGNLLGPRSLAKSREIANPNFQV